MKKLLREPLLHFLLLGAGLFALYAWLGGPSVGEGERVVITQGRVEQLASGFARMHQRAPDAAELKGLIDDAVREEIYYREAKALALDEDDTIVRRRLQQKLEFVSEDVSRIAEPSDAQLQAYLQAHPEKFSSGLRYSFSHLYLNPERHGAQTDADARRMLATLVKQGVTTEPDRRGDPFLLGLRFDDIGSDELARLFGKEFEQRLRAGSVGQWQGPLSSGYGTHLVLLRNRAGEQVPALASVRSEVREQWIGDQRLQANEKFYADLRKRYTVTIEPLAAGGPSAQVVGVLP